MSPRKRVRAVLRDPSCELGRSARAVLLALLAFADDDDGRAFPSVSTVATITGYHEGTVRRALGELAAAGVVTAPGGRSGGRRPTDWYLTAHACAVPTAHGHAVNRARVRGWSPNRAPVRAQGAHQMRAEVPVKKPDTPTDDNKTGPAPPAAPMASADRARALDAVRALREGLTA